MGSEFWSSVIGAVIGGSFAIVAVVITLWFQNRHAKKRQDNITQGLLEAIYEELNALWDQIKQDVVYDLEQYEKRTKGGELIFGADLSVSQDYLAIYRSNTNLILQIEDSDLKRDIVRVYILLQAFIERYEENTRLLNERGKLDESGTLGTSQSRFQLLTWELKFNAQNLIVKHYKIEKLIGIIFVQLREKYNIGNSASG